MAKRESCGDLVAGVDVNVDKVNVAIVGMSKRLRDTKTLLV